MILIIASLTLASNNINIVPGDIIRITSYDDSLINGVYTVSSQGTITFPMGTPIDVAGSEEHMNRVIRDELSNYYTDPENITIEVVFKGISVRIAGFVMMPGQYSLNGNATLEDLINKAGGLRDGAVIDRFLISNNQGETKLFNFRQYLESGSMESQLNLKNGDLVFVPMSPTMGNIQRTLMGHLPQPDESRRNVVNILGEVANPGAYEINQQVTVLDMIAMAGGPMIPRNTSMVPDLENIKIIHPRGDSVQVEIFNLNEYFNLGDDTLLTVINAGDNILLPAKKVTVEDKSKVVSVLGAVESPLTYEIAGSINLTQIIARAGGVLREEGIVIGDLSKITVIRPDSLKLHKYVLDITTVLGTDSGAQQFELFPNDIVFVPNKAPSDLIDEAEVQYISIIGEVITPGRYPVGTNDNIITMLARAGGPRLETARDEITLIRYDNGRKQRFLFDIEEFHNNNQLLFNDELCLDNDECVPGIPTILPGDMLIVDRKPIFRVDLVIKLVAAISSATLLSISLADRIGE